MLHRAFLLLSFAALLAACNSDDAPTEAPLAGRPPSLIDPAGPFGPEPLPLPIVPEPDQEPQPQPEPEPDLTIHLSLLGTDDVGGMHSVPGAVRLRWRNPESGELLGELVREADAQGSVKLALGALVDDQIYELNVTVSDEWYFAPGSVRFFYGREYSGAELAEVLSQPVVLTFRPNASVAYIHRVGVTADFPVRFNSTFYLPDIPVFEVTVSVPGARDAMDVENCDYFMEDFYLYRYTENPPVGRVPMLVDYEIKEAWPDSRCGDHYTGKYLIAIRDWERQRIEDGADVDWDSFVAVNVPDDDDLDELPQMVMSYTSSRLFYLDEVLYGAE